MGGFSVGSAIVVLGGLLAATSASAGPAAWCGGVKTDAADVSGLNTKDAREIVLAYVRVECSPTPEVEAHRAEIEAGRAAWSKKLGMVEADWADAVAWSQKDQYSLKADLSTKKFADMTPLDQWEVMVEADGPVVGSGGGGGQGGFDSIYLADVFGDKLSQVARVQLIHACLERHSAGGNELIWAACAADLASFSFPKLADELRADSAHKGDIKQKLRILAVGVAADIKQHAEDVSQLMATDVAWKKVFDLATKSRSEWAAIATKNAEFLALASDLESAYFAQSRSMFEGCDDKTFAALGKAVGDLKAADFAKIFDVRDDPFHGFAYKALPQAMRTPSVFNASIAVALCNQRKGLASVVGEALGEVPSLRGPRGYAIGKLEFSGIELDKVGAKIEKTSLEHPYSGLLAGGNLTSAGAPIKTITKKGGKLVVAPTSMMVKREDCVKEHTTNHIDRFVNGEVRYVIQCDKTAMVMHDEKWGDFTIDARYEKLLKPGLKFSATDVSGDQGGMTPIAVWASATADKPMWLLAGPVK